MRRALLAVAGWLLAAAVAVVVGLLAVSLLGTGITGEQVQPLSSVDVARALAQSRESSGPSMPPPSGSTAAASSTASSPPAPSAPAAPAAPAGIGQVSRALDSAGGSLIARCTDATVYLLSWTPRQGFETDDVVRGPAPAAFMTFDSEDLDIFVTIECRDGVPVLVEATEADD